MTWTTLSFSVGQILTAAQMNNMYSNFAAMGAADTGAPSIVNAALSSHPWHQADLSTTTGAVSTVSTTPTLLTLPGGEYGFYPSFKHVTNTGGGAALGHDYTATEEQVTWTTSYVTRIVLWCYTGSGGTQYAQQRYVQASPPYDLGDGQIPLFMFALVDNTTGDIIALYVAQEAPWHYNGPTYIAADFYDSKGVGFQRRPQVLVDTTDIVTQFNAGTPAQRIALLNKMRADKQIDVEVTQSIKNADMNLIPHPFIGNDLTGKTVVMLDPMASATQDLFENHLIGQWHKDIDGPNELLHAGYLKIGNTEINRARPNGVMSVSLNWK